MTETVLIDDGTRALRTLQVLQTLGIRLALDALSAGLASLSCVRRFPLDIVKIDRSFNAPLGSDPTSAAMVSAITDLSHALDMTVVAAGVETARAAARRCERGLRTSLKAF